VLRDKISQGSSRIPFTATLCLDDIRVLRRVKDRIEAELNGNLSLGLGVLSVAASRLQSQEERLLENYTADSRAWCPEGDLNPYGLAACGC